jgi:hypothetical protein
LGVALVSLGEQALAQSAKTLPEQLIGTWTFVLAEVTAADGSTSLPFGDAHGHSHLHGRWSLCANSVASDLPKIASNNRLTGTPEEYKAINQRSLRPLAPTRSMKRRP